MDKKGWRRLRKKEDGIGKLVKVAVFGTTMGVASVITSLAFNLHWYDYDRLVKTPTNLDASMVTEPSSFIFEVRDTIYPVNEEIEQTEVQREAIRAQLDADEEEKQKKKERKKKKREGRY